MAKAYRLGPWTRLINWVFRSMTRLGVGAPYRHILTVRGRKSGRLRSTPVDVIEAGDQRWVVAGYGPAIERRLSTSVTAGREGDLRVAKEWLAEGRGDGIGDLVIENDRPIRDVAQGILSALQW